MGTNGYKKEIMQPTIPVGFGNHVASGAGGGHGPSSGAGHGVGGHGVGGHGASCHEDCQHRLELSRLDQFYNEVFFLGLPVKVTYFFVTIVI